MWPSLIAGAVKDEQSATSDWIDLAPTIQGVRVREVKNVVKSNGDVLCEIFRRDWRIDDDPVDQVFQVVLNEGAISAWHLHRATTDRLFVGQGLVRIVLYDDRPDSTTAGLVSQYRFGSVRPALVRIPPGVWHGVQNLSPGVSVLL